MKTLLTFLLLWTTSTCFSQTTIVIWKQDAALEIVHDSKVIATYQICSLADRNFPKRRAGDMRTPEGTYAMTFINHHSSSYKTIGVGYPNAEDRKRGYTGGGIGIHGKCCSSGCIGMSNEDMDSIIATLDKLHAIPKSCTIEIYPSRDKKWVEKRAKEYPEYR